MSKAQSTVSFGQASFIKGSFFPKFLTFERTYLYSLEILVMREKIRYKKAKS